jgi:uncharacterized membrane protein
MTITNHKRHLVVLGLGFVASVAVFSKALGPYLTFEGEHLSHEILTLFLLPITASVIFLLIESLRVPRASPPHDPAADATLDSIVFCILLFLMGVHGLVLSVLLQVEAVQPWASRGVVVLLGLTLIAIGNLLPRTRPNVALGFRTARTLADRRLWMLTHRASGYIAVAVGAVTVLSGVLAAGMEVAQWTAAAFLVGAVLLIASYWTFSRVSTGGREI